MFIDANLHSREKIAQGTTEFLQSQLDDAKRNLDEKDKTLAAFQQKYMGSLPDDVQTNVNLLTAANSQFDAVTQSLARAQQDKVYTASLLAQQKAAMEGSQTATSIQPDALEQQLSSKQTQLIGLDTKYTSDHPDLIRLKAEISELKERIQKAANKTADAAKETRGANSPVNSPQIQQLEGQLHSYDEGIKAYTKEQDRLREQIKLYQSRIQLSPVVEEEFKKITRDYQTALTFYNELLSKRAQAGMGTDLEKQEQGEQFRVLDPASLPEEPTFPNRPLFAGGGLGVGLAIGVGLVLLLEMRDKSLRTENEVEHYLGLATLVLLPSFKLQEGVDRRNSKEGVNSGLAS